MPIDEVFQNNLNRWAKFCPEEACKLPDIDASDVIIRDGLMQIGQGEESFAAQDGGDPIGEAAKCIESINLRDIHVLYVLGVGAGFMFEALRPWLAESSLNKVVFIEEDLKVIRRLFETERGTEILFHPQVWLYHLDPEGRVIERLSTLFILQPWNFIALNRYRERNPTFVDQTKAKISFLSNLKYHTTYEYLHFGWGYFQNFFKNILLLPNAKPANTLYNRFAGIPAIICGAGPSLKKNLHILETLKDRALIFAGGTSMNAVNANGFVPHFGIGIDPNIDQLTRLITNIAFETPYFYRNRLLHAGLEIIHGDRLYVPGSGGYGITRWFEKELDIVDTDIQEGCNVINFSLSIASALGCNPIILVGVDLAYSDEQPYAPGIVNHPLYNKREFFRTKNTQEELIVKPDIYGKGVYTLWKWVMESFWFANFARQNPQINLINATEGGIGFIGVPNMPLKEVAEQYLNNPYDYAGLLHAEMLRAQMPAVVTRKKIASLMEEFSESLSRCEKMMMIIHGEIAKLAEEHRNGLPIPEDMLTERAKEEVEKVKNELAYEHFLKVFEEAFQRVYENEVVRLEIDRDILGPEKVREEELILLAKKYKFLVETVRANTNHLQEALEAAKVRTNQLERLEAEHQAGLHRAEAVAPSWSFDDDNSGIERKIVQSADGKPLCEYCLLKGALHGPFNHYSESGALVAQSWFVNGVRDGNAVCYFEDGSVASVEHYRGGKKEGPHRSYYPDGTLRSEIAYSSDKLHGAVRLYDKFGRLSREQFFSEGSRNGADRIWNEEGLMVVEAFYKNNRPADKARRWYGNGNLAFEALFDPEGQPLATRKWDVNGQPIAEADGDKDDYFDKVTKQTGVLTNSLNDVVNQVAHLAPFLGELLGANVQEGEIKEINGDILKLKEEMEKLKTINQQLMEEAGLDPNHHKEPLWKTPSSRRQLELQIEEKSKDMAKEISHIQETLVKAIDGLAKNLDKKNIDP